MKLSIPIFFQVIQGKNKIVVQAGIILQVGFFLSPLFIARLYISLLVNFEQWINIGYMRHSHSDTLQLFCVIIPVFVEAVKVKIHQINIELIFFFFNFILASQHKTYPGAIFLHSGAFTYDVRFSGRQIGQHPASDFTICIGLFIKVSDQGRQVGQKTSDVIHM